MQDMTKGPTTRLMVLFAIPLLFGNLLQQLYSMVDTIVVGRYVGYQALASVGATAAVIQLLIGIALGLSNGVSIITSQYFGAREEAQARKSVAMGITVCGAASVVIGVAGMAAARSMYLVMQTPEDIIDGAVRYTMIMFAGAPATLLYNYVSSVLRAFGDSKTPVIGLLIASVLNVALDLIFVIVFDWGIAGVAVATLIAQLVAGVLCGCYAVKKLPILRFEKSDFSWNAALVLEQLKVGIPLAFQQSVLAMGTVFMQVVLNTLGSLTIAAYTVVARIDVFLYSCLSAFGTAATTYSAQNYGAGRIDRIRAGVRGACVVTVGFCIAFAVIVNLLATPLMQVFVGSEALEVIGMGVRYIRIAAMFYPLLGVIFIMHSSEQGIGMAVVAMMASFVELAARPTAAYLLTRYFGFTGFCFANPAAWASAFLMVFISYLMIINRLERRVEVNYETKLTS